MKWNGIVSQFGTIAIAARLASAKPTQARSTQWRCSGRPKRSTRGDSIALTSHGGDRLGAQLGPEPAHVDVDHVGAGIEVVLPDGGEQSLLGDGRAGVEHELPQQQELAVGQRDRPRAAVGLAPDQVQAQAAGDQAGGWTAGGGAQPASGHWTLVAVALRQERTSTAWVGRSATSRRSTAVPSRPGMSRSRMTRS